MSKKNRKSHKHSLKNNENALKECTLFVDGMHCASCEILIEKKLLKQEGIESAEASLADGRVSVVYSGGKPDIEELNEVFKTQNYKFADRKFKHRDSSPLFQIKNGSLLINPDKLKNTAFATVIVSLLLAAFFAVERSGLSAYMNVTPSSSMPAFFIFGLLAGTSSCAALVGGFLLSMSKQWSEVYIAEDSAVQRAKPFIMFNIGRLISFMILGGMLGLLGGALGLSFDGGNTTLTAILVLVVSALMVLLSFQMLGAGWANKFQFRMPRFVTRFAANEENFQGKYMPTIAGAFTFFMPCGFTLIAQSIALTSGSFLTGAVIMMFFALGTLPMLAIISLSSVKFTSRPHLTLRFNTVAGMLVLFFAIYNINAQLNALGVWSLSDIKLRRVEARQDEITVDPSGTQKLSIVAQGFSYTPTTGTTLKAGVQTTLEVDNKGITGCGAYMSARGLFTGYWQLQPGLNSKQFTPQKGQYKITCSMGMVAPVTVSVI